MKYCNSVKVVFLFHGAGPVKINCEAVFHRDWSTAVHEVFSRLRSLQLDRQKMVDIVSIDISPLSGLRKSKPEIPGFYLWITRM